MLRQRILKQLKALGCKIVTERTAHNITDSIFFPWPENMPNALDRNPKLYTYYAGDKEQKSLQCIFSGGSWTAKTTNTFLFYYAYHLKITGVSLPLVANGNSVNQCMRDIDRQCWQQGYFMAIVKRESGNITTIRVRKSR